ncbi:hypothetical protein GH714_002069 [Hevea brasiliensis]|uniref:NAD-dependent epimerase/dehydratase domain-containing protein n=1 Tax=Hevea brasiliensis TaxID=3981 RepID=A0A6A6L1A3_HEVBR|nr:hypothetical protein GH714_002069 [Hevea brasiliensis]
MSGEGKVVSVTGASRYIASWLVKFLLQRGYTVKASVRDPKLIAPALKGTLNILKSCTKVPSIKGVVITSSMAAVAFNGKPLAPDVIIDETWFSDPDICEKSKLRYMLSKTLAEEATWKFTKENGIDMVAINPGLVIGPLLQPTLNTSTESILNLVNGAEKYPNTTFRWLAEKYPNTTFRWVDARDVSNAHVYAFENHSASGRYCLVGAVARSSEAVEILRKLFPELNHPKECQDDKPFVPKYEVSKEKAKVLGIDFIPLDVSVVDTIESLKEKGFLNV